MIVIPIVCFASAFIAFESALTVLRLNRRAAVNLVYAVFTMDYALLCVAFGLFMYSPTKETAWVWSRVLIVPMMLLPSLVLHFTLLIGARPAARSPVVWALLYAPVAIIAVQGFRLVVGPDIYRTPWGWEHAHTTDSIWTVIGIAQCVGFYIASLAVMVRRYRALPPGRERLQARPVTIALITGTVGWAVSLACIYADDPVLVTVVSNLSFVLFVTPFIVGVRWSIARYGLMTLAPERPAAELMAGMHEPVFLVDMDGNIVFGNGMARALSANAGAAAPRTIFELFPRIEIIRRELDAMAAGKSRSGYVNCTISTRKGERIAYTLNIQGIKNEVDDCIGALVIASEDPSIRDFRVRFGITERQIEILYLSVSGLSNREIAKRLGLSERTVEHHHFNIYNKLGVDNKIELYNIALKYRILSN